MGNRSETSKQTKQDSVVGRTQQQLRDEQKPIYIHMMVKLKHLLKTQGARKEVQTRADKRRVNKSTPGDTGLSQSGGRTVTEVNFKKSD